MHKCTYTVSLSEAKLTSGGAKENAQGYGNPSQQHSELNSKENSDLFFSFYI